MWHKVELLPLYTLHLFKDAVMTWTLGFFKQGSIEITPTVPLSYPTVVGGYIHTMKTTFYFNFELNQAVN